MRLWIALHLPLLPLEVFRPNWLADDASVVLENNRVVAMSPPALAAGVQIGMRRGGAQMLLPTAIFQSRDSVREQAALDTAAIALLQFSPLVTGAEQASLLIEVGASLRLFGGVRALCRRILQVMATLGFTVRLASAPTARAAWLFAQQVPDQALNGKAGKAIRRRCLSFRHMQTKLDSLPVNLLLSATPWLDWLQGIACATLSELRQLPRPGLQRRCGKALLQELDCAYGDEQQLFEWIEAPPSFKTKMELPDRMEHAEPILAFARSMLVQLAGWLVARQLAVSQITLQLEHERGRQAIPATVLIITLAEAVWREEYLTRLLKEHLAHLELKAPVIQLILEASKVEPMAAPSASLFPEPGGNMEDHRRLIELLIARLGADNVLQAAPQADHRPEVANQWISVLQKTPKMAAQSKLLRPTWLLSQPLALSVQKERPCYGSPLKMLSGEERIEAGWWNGQLVTRDYFIAESADHVHYWVYRERLGALKNQQQAWYLHGVFG